MKKRLIAIFLVIVLIVHWAEPCSAEMKPEPQESKELMFQDMLMLFLLPHINKKVGEIYSNILKYSPMDYPYFVDVIHVERVNGFRGFHFLITLEVVPTTGPHIAVGKDSITMDISPTNPEKVKIVGWKHLKDPQETNFPPN